MLSGKIRSSERKKNGFPRSLITHFNTIDIPGQFTLQLQMLITDVVSTCTVTCKKKKKEEKKILKALVLFWLMNVEIMSNVKMTTDQKRLFVENEQSLATCTR